MTTIEKTRKYLARKRRTRAKISGTDERPRLAVYVSNTHISVQVVDDANGRTLAAASDASVTEKLTKTDKARQVGKVIAEQAVKKGIKKVAFDRAGRRYHGRVRALAEGAREAGLDF